jgi:hypothetical protein
MKKLIVFLAFFYVVLAGAAGAQVFVEEGKVVLSVSGGERINKSITVNNTSPEAQDLRVYWEDFEYVAPFDGAKKFMAAGTGKGSASQWVKFAPQEFKIPPFGRQKIDYTVTVPADIEGGHYGVLFFERVSDSAQNGTGVKIVTRIGSLMFIESKDKVKKAELKDVKAGAEGFKGLFVNAGNAVLIPRMTYYFVDSSGVAVDRGDIPQLYVPVGAEAPWTVALPKGITTGQFSLVVNADLDDGDLVVKEITFTRDSAGAITIDKVQD